MGIGYCLIPSGEPMRSEAEIKEQLAIDKPRLETLKEAGIQDEALYYEGFIDALEWVLGKPLPEEAEE